MNVCELSFNLYSFCVFKLILIFSVQRRLLADGDAFKQYVDRIQNPTSTQHVQNMRTVEESTREMFQFCQKRVDWVNSQQPRPNPPRLSSDGRSGTFYLDTVRSAMKIPEALKNVEAFLTGLGDFVNMSPSVTLHGTVAISSILTGCIEEMNALNASLGNDLTKDPTAYARARGRVHGGIVRRRTEKKYAVRTGANQIYVGRIRWSHVDAATSQRIKTHISRATKEYNMVKTDPTIAKDPAVKEFLFYLYRERANTLRSHHKKPCGISSYDFRGARHRTICTETFAPVPRLTRYGISIPSTEYTVRSQSIAIIMEDDAVMGGDGDPWWYLLTLQSLHTTCAHDFAPIHGKWVELTSLAEGKFQLYQQHPDPVNVYYKHIVQVENSLMVFTATKDTTSQRLMWCITNKSAFQHFVQRLKEIMERSSWRESVDASQAVEDVISDCDVVSAVHSANLAD